MSVSRFQGLLSDLELARLVFILYFLSLEVSASSMDHTSPSLPVLLLRLITLCLLSSLSSVSPQHHLPLGGCMVDTDRLAIHSFLGVLCPAHFWWFWYKVGEA